MKASMRAVVLAAMHRPAKEAGGKDFLDVFFRQDGEQGVIEAYAEPIALDGLIPTAGEAVVADVTVWTSRSGRQMVRVDAFRAA